MALQRAAGFVRAWLPAAVMAAFAAVLIARLVQLQVLEHRRFAEAAQSELEGSTIFYARRGTILDRNGHVLAMSIDAWDVYVNKRTWETRLPFDPAQALAGFLKIPPQAIRERLASAPGVNILVASDVDYETGLGIKTAAIPGLTLTENTVRVYPEGDIGAGILGLTGADNTGLAGLEHAYNDLLQGKPGRALFERDTTGEPIPYGYFVAETARPGHDIELTIDRHLQQLAETALADAVAKHRAQGGTIIMLDPATGAILALASSPSFTFSTLDLSGEADLGLLRNRAVSDLYEPGSVMKVITAAAAIDRGVVSPDTTYVDTGIVWAFGIPISNWDDRVYGQQTMTGVLQHSINSGAIFMVQKLGQAAFHGYLDAFGFGRPTGIDMPGEASGIIRKPSEPGYSPLDVLTQSFGQSISVTPIQMISAIAAVINGGTLMQPHLVQATIDRDGVRHPVMPRVLGHPIRPDTSATLRDMLRQVVEPESQWHPGKLRDYTAGGKSGTANVPVPNGYDDRQIASFVGFAPSEEPRILILVKLDQNADLLTGTQAAAPVFAALANETLHYLGVEPDAARYASAR